MPTVLEIAANDIANTHPFFTAYWNASGGLAGRRLAATKLLLYEVRGRPWNSLSADRTAFNEEVTKWNPRPAFGQAKDRVVAVLDRFAGAPFVAGETLLSRGSTFPAVYWAISWTSGVQLPWVRDIINKLEGLPSPSTVSSADRSRYQAAKSRPNESYANLLRAQIIMKYNAPDVWPTMPQEALVRTPSF